MKSSLLLQEEDAPALRGVKGGVLFTRCGVEAHPAGTVVVKKNKKQKNSRMEVVACKKHSDRSDPSPHPQGTLIES